MEKNLKNLIVVGDRVLIKPKSFTDRTKTGLYLPIGIQEKEVVQSGYVMKVGPGYPISQTSDDVNEAWKGVEEKVKYIPLQV